MYWHLQKKTGYFAWKRYVVQLPEVIFFNGITWTIFSTKNYLVVICEGATGGLYSAKDAPAEPYQANWGPRYEIKS